MSNTRLWIFRLIAVVIIPCIFIFGLEGVLRLFNVGHSVSFTTVCKIDGQDYFCENSRFIEQFFPKEIARQPVSFAYPAEKTDGTFRIFILGASAAQGDPEPSYGFSRILKVLLRERFPSLNFEVINTAITATNSHVVLPIAREVSLHQPDLTIIYLGNNEVVGPFGAGTIFSQISPNLSLIRAGIQLKATRIGQVINSAISKTGESQAPKKWQGMEMFLGNQVRSDSKKLETVYQHYQENLSDIIRTFSTKNIPVVVSTVGSNIKDFPPLASLHRPSLTAEESKRWDFFYQQGIERFQADRFNEALLEFGQAEQIDDGYADLQFLIGQSFLNTGNLPKASDRLVRSRDLDTLRFRADSRINNIIRSVAKENVDDEVFLVDMDDRFNQQSPQQIQGNELYHEHVHLNFHGNYLLARDIAEIILQSLPKGADVGHTFLSEQDCSRRLALTLFDQLRIQEELYARLKKPPFSMQMGNEERLNKRESNNAETGRLLTPLAIENADTLYRQALTVTTDDPWLYYNYGIFLKDQKRFTSATKQLQIFTSLLPHNYKGHHELAVILATAGRFEEAIPHYQTAINLIRITSVRTELRLLKAYALARMGRYDESMQTYRETLAEDPSSAVNVYHAMAKIKIKTGPLAEAEELLQQAISHNSDGKNIPDIYFNYGHVLKQLKQNEQSIAAYNKAIEIYETQLPSAAGKDRESLLLVTGRSYFAIGDVERGSDYLQQTIKLAPNELEYHLTLIAALARNGHKMEARKFTAQALQIMSESGRRDAVSRLEEIRRQLN